MNFLVALHSWLRWILLILLLASIVKSLSGFSGKKALSAGDKKLWLFTMISAHTTLLIGLILLFVGKFGIINGTPEGVSVMKDPFYRFYWVEHPVMMIIAIALITVGRGQAKKSISDYAKYKKAFWFFLIALVVILAAIPWPSRPGIGRALIPGM
ncbi:MULTISPECIES: hypothetical protein [Niastella]|uniref:Cytochrome B n=1 Tax=Niastella soli TaxID=2821487 RepID=A0ABS3Z4K1_9BACT|nr:hypothetical protein [Niastella soli]MBO9205097.1 hypothetical protein [Niastella soli]